MERTLGPRNVGDILKETFTIYKNNWARFAAIVAIVAIPIAIIAIIVVAAVMLPVLFHYTEMEQLLPSLENIIAIIPAFMLIVLISFVAGVLMQTAVIHAVAEQYFRQPVNIGLAFRFTWRRFPNTLGAAALTGLAAIGIIIIIIGIPAAIYFSAPFSHSDIYAEFPQLMIIGITLAAVAFVAIAYLSVIWAFAIYAALLEGCGPVAALSRSMALVKGSWWRVFGIIILLTLIVQVINWIAGLVPLIGGIAAAIFTPPITITGVALLYFDLRVRKQGYNLEALANELGLVSTAAEPASSPPQ